MIGEVLFEIRDALVNGYSVRHSRHVQQDVSIYIYSSIYLYVSISSKLWNIRQDFHNSSRTDGIRKVVLMEIFDPYWGGVPHSAS